MNQFSKKDKKHIRSYHAIPYKELLKEGTKESDISHKLYRQMIDFNEDYAYWKERFSQINTMLIYLKSLKTNLYKMVDTKEKVYIDWPDWERKVQEINEKLFWWRNYYSKAKPIYDDVKRDALHAQACYLHFLQDKDSKRLEAKNFEGKHLYKICVKSKVGWHSTYYVRSDSDYLDENNFKDEFRYDIELAVSRFGDKLKEFNWNACWHLSDLFKFYDDLEIKIYEMASTCSVVKSDVLIDFSEFRAWRNNSISEAHRVTFNDFIEHLKEENQDLTGFLEFRTYIAEHLEESPEDISFIRKTIHYWNKFYKMFKNGEWPQDRSKKKC